VYGYLGATSTTGSTLMGTARCTPTTTQSSAPALAKGSFNTTLSCMPEQHIDQHPGSVSGVFSAGSTNNPPTGRRAALNPRRGTARGRPRLRQASIHRIPRQWAAESGRKTCPLTPLSPVWPSTRRAARPLGHRRMTPPGPRRWNFCRSGRTRRLAVDLVWRTASRVGQPRLSPVWSLSEAGPWNRITRR
jgi:hypothetical protein